AQAAPAQNPEAQAEEGAEHQPENDVKHLGNPDTLCVLFHSPARGKSRERCRGRGVDSTEEQNL
ncbi:MAG TPA: hypothetical protein VM490_01310, partial [Armatimonadaceae bacterium]|nr:hypothetical protein [Armatimonadaceae bacterium]